MVFDFDLTFVPQMLLFALLTVALRPLLFNPVLHIFEERERRTEGARASARQMQEEAGVLLRLYESELASEHEIVRQERERVRHDTARLEAELMREARERAKKIIQEGSLRIERECREITFGLGRESERLAHDIVKAVLGRSLH